MILLTGVAGAGKSMQGRMLADEYGYAWISTGEILRVLVTGKRRQQMLEGKLLSDQEMVGVMDRVLQLIDTGDEFVLDGFPRTLIQAEWLLNQSKLGRFELTAVFHLTASEQVVEQRLQERGRQDDTHTAIRARFDEYQAVTMPILEHYKQVGVQVYDIDAGKSPRAVHEAIVGQLQKLGATAKV
jgi:adenylate kinase